MKKIVFFGLIMLFMCTLINAEEETSQSEVYVQASPSTVIPFSASRSQATLADMVGSDKAAMLSNHNYPMVPINKVMESQIAETLLKFDNIASLFNGKSRTLGVDTMELRIAFTVKGDIYVVSGTADSAVTITLKKK